MRERGKRRWKHEDEEEEEEAKKKKTERRRASRPCLLRPGHCAGSKQPRCRRADGQTNRHATQLLVLSRLVSNGARQRDRTAVLPPPRAPPLPMPAVTGYGIAG
jgi:hypothetical protein